MVNVKDIVSLDGYLDSKWRLRVLGRNRRRVLRAAIIEDWQKQGAATTDKAMAKRVAADTGFPWVLMIQLIAKAIVWWIENRRKEKTAYAVARLDLQEGE